MKRRSFAAIILAAGEGKRMRSDLPKVCHPLAGKPLIAYPIDLARAIKSEPIVLVLSADPEKKKAICQSVCKSNDEKNLSIAIQKNPLGTGHAVLSALPQLKNFDGTVLVFSGDVPLLKTQTILSLLKQHHQKKASISVMTMVVPKPKGYGRILRNGIGFKIVEERDASPQEKKISEVNSGVYAFDAKFLKEKLPLLKRNNAQHEYYLTDLPQMALQEKKKVHLFLAPSYQELLGVNTQEELFDMEQYLQKERLRALIAKGVKIVDPNTTYISPEAKLSPGCVIFPGSMILGKSSVAKEAQIGPNAILEDTRVQSRARVKAFSVLEESLVGKEAQVGPFAHLRPGSVLKQGAKVGNFVELKKTVMEAGAKANHLAYLGDSQVGQEANVGAGTITCNYDGFFKHPTKIGAGVFIGSDVQLVAPVNIGKNALVAAGTTVTRDVPSGALAISRTKQDNKKGWAKKRSDRLSRKKNASKPKKKR